MDAIKLNRSDYILIGGYFLFVTIWLVYKFYLYNYSLWEYFYEVPIIWAQSLSLLFVSKWLIENYLIKKQNYLLLVIVGFGLFWFISFLQMVLCEIIPIGGKSWGKFPEIGELIIQNVNESVFNVCIPLFLISGKKYHEYQLNNLKVAEAKKDLELKTLRSQFAPHFLFNNLNTVDALIDREPEKAKQYIAHLANLYRYITENKEDDIVQTTKELQFVDSYIYLIKTRFYGEYEFNIQVNQTIDDQYLPTGAIQTLLENVIKHNITNDSNPIIRTDITIQNNTITVKNNKGANTTTKTTKSGIDNLKKRYQLLTDDTIITKDFSDYFEVELPLLNVEKLG